MRHTERYFWAGVFVWLDFFFHPERNQTFGQQEKLNEGAVEGMAEKQVTHTDSQ